LSQILLSASSLFKSFEGVRALRGVSFELRAGEVQALVGENGAGKSTLIKIMTGAEQPEAGTLTVAGRPVPRMTPALARALGIAVIYQQPSLFPHLTVAENIALALETGPAWRRVRWNDRRRRATALLGDAGAAIDPARLAGSLSMPEQQMVEIAKAIGADARIVIMDEPTASLMDDEVARLLQTIGMLRGRGAGIVYISHRLEEVFSVSDRVTVLRDGETVATRETTSLDKAELIQAMVGRAMTDVFPKRQIEPGAVAIELRQLSNAAAGLHDVSSRGSSDRDERSWRKRCSDSNRRMAAKSSSTARRSASNPRNRRSAWASPTSPRIAAVTAWCSRCPLRRTRRWQAWTRCRRTA
jgi:rhamnose transport system ATP-binding protein